MTHLSVSMTLAAILLFAAETQANPFVYEALLDGASEKPPNTSPGTGTATVTLDLAAHTMHVQVTFTDLLAATIASHIHAPTTDPLALDETAGVATTTPTFTDFPLGVTGGDYDHTFDMTMASSYNPSYITANGGTTTTAELALAQAIAAGKAYLNIHTTSFPGGEIRGFLVPEPSSCVLLAIGAGVALAYTRRRRCGRV